MRKYVTAEMLFTRLETVLPKFIDSHYDGRRDLCIAATRLIILAGRDVGLNVRPVVTYTYAANSAFVEWINTHDRAPTPAESLEHNLHLLKCAGVRVRPNGYPYHLIARIGNLAFDGSSGQFERPEKGIFAPRTLRFELDPVTRVAEVKLPANGLARYEQLDREEKGYESGFSWLNARRVAPALIRRLWPDQDD